MNISCTPRSSKGKAVVANWEKAAAGLRWKEAAVLSCEILAIAGGGGSNNQEWAPGMPWESIKSGEGLLCIQNEREDWGIPVWDLGVLCMQEKM